VKNKNTKKMDLSNDKVKELIYSARFVHNKSYNDIMRETKLSKTTIGDFLRGESHSSWWKENHPEIKHRHLARGRKTTDMTQLELIDDKVKLLVAKMSTAKGITVADICSVTGNNSSTIERFLAKETHKEWWDEYDGVSDEKVFSGSMDEPQYNVDIPADCNVFVITSAQNNTHVNENFLKTLENYCKRNKGKLLISPFVYNLDGILGSKQDSIVYDDKIVKYLVKDSVMLSEYLGGLVFCAELDILPTAQNPLSGLDTYTKQASAIIPHTKMQLESVPTHKKEPCKMLYTTGAVTLRNYIQRKAGQKASFHHVFGALVVEIDHDNKCWFVRQLNADKDGSFQDLTTVYKPDGTIEKKSVEAITWGDIHAEKCENIQKVLCFGKNGILDSLKPKFQFAHDVSDFTPRNHHNRHDPHFLFTTSLSEIRTVEDGLQQAANLLTLMSRSWCDTIVVNSNHDNALLKWLKEADYRSDPDNSLFFLKAQLRCYEAISRGDTRYSVFEDSIANIIKKPIDLTNLKITFLREDDTFKICTNDPKNAIECAYHGHIGANGTRGSLSAYQRLGHKVNIGHSHSANIREGVYQAGVTGNLDMEYNRGSSSWSHSHIVVYSNGKRAIITTHDSRWKL
jgi:hypothetical protein